MSPADALKNGVEMKIAYFVTKLPYNHDIAKYPLGGAQIAANNLAIEMEKKNHEINIFTTSADSFDYLEKNGNLSIYRYATNIRLLTSNISAGMFWKTFQHNADIIHIHFDIPPGPLAGLIYAKKKKVPLVVTYHGDWIDSYGGYVRKIGVRIHNKFFVDKLLSLADIIISPSKVYIDKSEYLKKYSKKVFVIPNGVELKKFSNSYTKNECRRILGLPYNKKLILFLGNLSPYKGPDVLLKALPTVIKRLPDVELIVAGKGVMLNQLKELSKTLGIESKVHFLGFIEESRKAIVYNASDLFVLPSIMNTESFGIVNLEAMACGIPIVASNIGGIPDVVKDDICGLLVEPNDPDALSISIIKILSDTELQERLGKEGRKQAELFSWEKIAKETTILYHKLYDK